MDKEFTGMEDKKIDRRQVIEVSAKTLGAIYLAPATVSLLTAQRATAQSAPPPGPCCQCGRVDFQSGAQGPGWTISYTNCQCVDVTENIPVTPDPYSIEGCCNTNYRVIGPNYDQTFTINCLAPLAPVVTPW